MSRSRVTHPNLTAISDLLGRLGLVRRPNAPGLQAPGSGAASQTSQESESERLERQRLHRQISKVYDRVRIPGFDAQDFGQAPGGPGAGGTIGSQPVSEFFKGVPWDGKPVEPPKTEPKAVPPQQPVASVDFDALIRDAAVAEFFRQVDWTGQAPEVFAVSESGSVGVETSVPSTHLEAVDLDFEALSVQTFFAAVAWDGSAPAAPAPVVPAPAQTSAAQPAPAVAVQDEPEVDLDEERSGKGIFDDFAW